MLYYSMQTAISSLAETPRNEVSESNSITSFDQSTGDSVSHGSFTIEKIIVKKKKSKTPESRISKIGNKQYLLDLDKILSGKDSRTTLMIKNIPNKYTSKMLLAAIDETHKGTYDFVYLPIDFKNKCNVGYAFINMVSPSHIISFYEAFMGKGGRNLTAKKLLPWHMEESKGRSLSLHISRFRV